MTGEELAQMMEKRPVAAAFCVWLRMTRVDGMLVWHSLCVAAEVMTIVLRRLLDVLISPVAAILFTYCARKMLAENRSGTVQDLDNFCDMEDRL